MKSLLAARKYTCLFPVLILFIILFPSRHCVPQEGEETYNISLVKTADLDDSGNILEVDGKKVLTETYTVKDGDHLWQLLRERELLEKKNLAELLSVLKRLNSSLENVDMIHPGQRIVIPLVISPAGGINLPDKMAEVETVPLETIDDLELEEYVVRQGDSIIKIVEDLYDIPHRELYDEYLSSLRRLNPSIKDLNTVYPGQKIRLPIYSPKVVRQPIKEALPVSEPMTELQKEDVKVVAGQLAEIFTLMGEQWLQTGEHFFPLKAGGQLKLNAGSYPIVDLKNGKKVIVDLYNDLPERMSNLIMSNWDNYAVVHIKGDDDLRKAFDGIIAACGYRKIYGPGEPLVSGGEIPARITADKIIDQDYGATAEKNMITVINFRDEGAARNPDVIVSYLELSGIKVIDYPIQAVEAPNNSMDPDVLNSVSDMRSLVETLLGLAGRDFSTDVELPVYKNGKGDFNLVVHADYSVSIDGREHIIDLSGLGKDIVSLLKEDQYMVHSISNKKSPFDVLAGILDFLEIEYEDGPHQFPSISGPDTRNIILNIQGISFKDSNSKSIFATSLKLPQGVILFLNLNGYRVLQLPVSIADSK